MNQFTVLIALLSLLVPGRALASEPYDFVSAVVRSLEMCKMAQERQKTVDKTDMMSMMKGIVVFTDEIRQANTMITPYRISKNNYIRESADSLCIIYTSIVEDNEQLLSFVEKSLNDPREYALQQGTWLRKFSENRAREDEDWRMLLLATAMATHTLVDMERDVEGQVRFLTITQSERDELRSQLLRSFGSQIQGGPKAGQSSVVGSAGLLWEFLAKEWKPADTKE